MAIWQISQEREKAKKDWRLQKLFDALKGWLNRDTAISFAWLAKRTVYDWIEKKEDFCRQIEDCEEYWFAVVENEKNKLIKSWHWQAIDKELKSKKYAVYGDKLDIDQKTTHLWEIKIKLPT